MGKLRTIAALSPSEFFKTVFLSFLVLAAQFKILFSSNEQLIESLRAPAFEKPSQASLRGWTRLLEAADRNLPPKPSCLRRAAVLLWLARFMKIPCELKIGVRRENGKMEAHAWVESRAEVLEELGPSPSYEPLLKAVP